MPLRHGSTVQHLVALVINRDDSLLQGTPPTETAKVVVWVCEVDAVCSRYAHFAARVHSIKFIN